MSILDLDQNDEFLFALATMGITDDPTDENYAEYQSRKLEKFPLPMQELAKYLYDEVNNRCNCKSVQLTGSYSIMLENKTIGKILPLDDSVFIGFREENLAKPEEKDQKDNQKIQGVVFFGCCIQSKDQINEVFNSDLYHLS